eukprot:TRINITY_DN1801_c0_g1_i6.p1 TRINITY_DN1801_c0_g1~~TRINITY_DN1801_c0_g1_i6.p1  ORF type:complete len:536 (-),score=101.02 TRINITY_DN1801_c0_g1_i6:301-1908(-)
MHLGRFVNVLCLVLAVLSALVDASWLQKHSLGGSKIAGAKSINTGEFEPPPLKPERAPDGQKGRGSTGRRSSEPEQDQAVTLQVKIIGGNADQFCRIDSGSGSFRCDQEEPDATTFQVDTFQDGTSTIRALSSKKYCAVNSEKLLVCDTAPDKVRMFSGRLDPSILFEIEIFEEFGKRHEIAVGFQSKYCGDQGDSILCQGHSAGKWERFVAIDQVPPQRNGSPLEQSGSSSPQTNTMKADKRKVVVVMADTRDLPTSTPKSFEEASWEQLAAVVNFKYAQAHGYEFVHYRMGYSGDSHGDQVGCKHPKYGARHPSWCKLLGIFEALELESKLLLSSDIEDPLVMYVDSDMVFNKPEVALEDYLARSPVMRTIPMPNPNLVEEGFPLQGKKQPGGRCDAVCAAERANATMLVNMDPNGGFGNCGMQIYRSRDPQRSMALLSSFWNLNDPSHNTGFPWEQYSFNHWLWPEHTDQIKLIEDTNEFTNPERGESDSTEALKTGLTHGQRKVVVVMADTRDLPTSTPKSFEEASWEQLA